MKGLQNLRIYARDDLGIRKRTVRGSLVISLLCGLRGPFCLRTEFDSNTNEQDHTYPIRNHASKPRTNPTTTQLQCPDSFDRLCYLSFPLIYDAICIGLQVIFFYFEISMIFHVILSHGLTFYRIYRWRIPIISSL